MNKVAIVYWSGTGNTEALANAVAEGVAEKGSCADVLTSRDFDENKVAQYDTFAFGCPAMGGEELEDREFEPMFSAVLPKLNGKKVGLFGSFGWGDGEWMRNWQETTRNSGAILVADGVICNDYPDDNAITSAKNLGSILAET